jgi:hypothetical protein
MVVDEKAKSERVSLFSEYPMVALELGLIAREDFLALMQAVHHKLRQQAMISLGSLNSQKASSSKSMQDILDIVRNARTYGI